MMRIVIASFLATAFATLATAAPEVDFKSQIAPLLSAKCNDCHTAKKKESDKKPKGGLALDTPAGITSGGVLEAGDAESSELFLRLTLPETDDELMPPTDDGGPLSKSEIALIRRWIDGGARFSVGSGEALEKIPADLTAAAVLAMRAGEPNPDGVSHLQKIGATVSQLSAAEPQHLVIEWISTYHETGDKEIGEILHLAANVVEVDLARTKLTDAGLVAIGKLGRLTHLNLNRTAVTDAGLAHLADLRSLRWLNLYGTAITDASLAELAKHKKLEALYIWDTGITAEGAAKLRKALPKTKIVRETDVKADRFDNLDDARKRTF